MNSLILSEITTIKWLLVALLVVISLIALFMTSMFLYTMKNRKSQLESMARNEFINEAQLHEDSGDYEKLFQIAWARTADYPSDPTAHWFMALAQFHKKEWGKALSSFKHLQKIHPVWEKNSVEDYILEIQENLSGPKGTASNK